MEAAIKALLIGTLAPLLEPFLATKIKTVWKPADISLTELNVTLRDVEPDIIILYACDLIVPSSIFQKTRTINIHCSYLPWCRGPVPHLWTALEERPFGVTIHEVNGILDGGPMICREFIDTNISGHTLASIYELLSWRGALLLAENWEKILERELDEFDEAAPGSIHCYRMQRPYQHIINEGIHLPLPKLISTLRAAGMGSSRSPQEETNN